MTQPVFPIGIVHQPDTFQPTAPAPAPAPAPVINRQVHAKPDARPVAAASELLRNAEKKFQQHIASINPVGLDENRLHSEITAFADSPAYGQVDEAKALVAQRVADAGAAVDAIEQSLQPKGDTAQELRNTRAWSRAQRQLDAVPANQVAETARRLIANSDDDELGVLLQEVRSYLASKGQASDWLDAAVAERVPALAAARRKLQMTTQAQQIIQSEADRLRGRIINTTSPRSYAPVPFIDISRYDPDAGA